MPIAPKLGAQVDERAVRRLIGAPLNDVEGLLRDGRAMGAFHVDVLLARLGASAANSGPF